MHKQITFILFILGFLFLSDRGYAQEPLMLTTFIGSPLSKQDQTGFYDLVLIEAFRRAGRNVIISHLPAERSLTNADTGITDGDFVRISGLNSRYPNLLEVPEKITDFEFVAFTWRPDIQIKDWSSCKPYNVAIVRGWKILETNLEDVSSLVKVKDQRLLFAMLAKQRTDIVVYSRFEGYEMINQLNLKTVRVLEPPLATREMFLYLNKRHRLLVPAITKHLQIMKQDGSFEQIIEKTLKPYLMN
ncbi:MAG: transporter substrate-binding domain-containing protein, partial [Proteobacteria bacterium]|nr:transporter substrate-binding domain-containing protein [Pseudomonadota bacterium]